MPEHIGHFLICLVGSIWLLSFGARLCSPSPVGYVALNERQVCCFARLFENSPKDFDHILRS